MRNFPDHPVIQETERFGYIREPEYPEYDEDREYEERREAELDGAMAKGNHYEPDSGQAKQEMVSRG